MNLEFCRLCETPFSSKVAALQHYSGKKHKKKAEDWSPFNPTKPIDTKDDLRCDVCNVISESVTQMESHLAGKKHKLKMKFYLQEVNTSSVLPAMSSRGFCDFNNVEREEANPIDPSRFIQELILPKNLSGSFLDTCKPEEPCSFNDSYLESDFGIREMNNRFESDFEYRSEFDRDIKPSRPFNEDIQPDIKRGFGGMPPQVLPDSFYEDRMVPPWSNSISRSQLNSPYAPLPINRMGNKFPVQTLGPTKFRYSRQMQK